MKKKSKKVWVGWIGKEDDVNVISGDAFCDCWEMVGVYIKKQPDWPVPQTKKIRITVEEIS